MSDTKLQIILTLNFFFIFSCSEYSSYSNISPEPKTKSPAQIGFEKKTEFIDSLKATNPKIPILITRLDRSAPNSAGGVDLKIELDVLSEKTIKYIRFTVDAYNRVNDKVSCEIRRESRRTGKTTGPYEKGFHTKYPWTWENLFYNNSISCFKLINVEIDYMDGTDEIFIENQVGKLMIPQELMYFDLMKSTYFEHYSEFTTKGCCSF